MSIPKPPSMRPEEDVQKGQLTLAESGFILDDCLHPKNRKDPTVICFIDSFIRCKNIAQASSECGVRSSLGYQIRHRSDVANAIQKLIDKSTIKYGFDASEIMERAKEIVDFDPIMLQNPDGTFKSKMHEIPPEARRNLKSMKVKNIWSNTEDMNGIKTKIIVGELIEYEFYDKLKAVELVGKEKDMFKNKSIVEHGVTKDMASILLASAQRGAQASLGFKDVRVVDAEIINHDVMESESDE